MLSLQFNFISPTDKHDSHLQISAYLSTNIKWQFTKVRLVWVRARDVLCCHLLTSGSSCLSIEYVCMHLYDKGFVCLDNAYCDKTCGFIRKTSSCVFKIFVLWYIWFTMSKTTPDKQKVPYLFYQISYNISLINIKQVFYFYFPIHSIWKYRNHAIFFSRYYYV